MDRTIGRPWPSPSMTETLREQWRRFASRPAGRRFQMRWRARREKPAGFARKLFLMGLGAVLVVLGAVMLVLPGPGLLVLLIGTALIAEESLFVARLVDRVDLAFARGLQRWRARRAAKRA